MLNKDDAVQTDNVNFEGENEELIKLSLKEANSDSRFPNKLIGCPSFSSTMSSREVKLSKLFSLNSICKELLIIQVHIDDVIFEATFEVLCEEKLC